LKNTILGLKRIINKAKEDNNTGGGKKETQKKVNIHANKGKR
jgi:hypothetical protein